MGDFPPKEGMLWIFFARKIRRLRPGSNPRSWVPEASMLTTRPPKPQVQTVGKKKKVIHVTVRGTSLIMGKSREGRRHWWVTIRMRSTPRLNTIPVCDTGIVYSFPHNAGKWTGVFRMLSGYSFFRPTYPAVTTSRSVPLITSGLKGLN